MRITQPILLVLVVLCCASRTQQENVALTWFSKITSIVTTTEQSFPKITDFRIYIRADAVISECVYDAWTAFSKGTPSSGVIISHKLPKTTANVKEAVSYAAHKAFSELFGIFGESIQSDIDQILTEQGYSLSKVGKEDLSEASGVGIAACSRVLAWRENDGSNQKATEPTSVDTSPYSEYTYYAPVNDPMPQVGKTDCSLLRDINHWQPTRTFEENGETNTEVYNGTHWSILKPFGFDNTRDFLASPPSGNNTLTQAKWLKKNQELVEISATLDDYRKILAHFWYFAEAPLYLEIVLNATKEANLNLENTIKFFFVTAEAIHDAVIVELYNKRFYDHARPTTTIQCIYKNQTINSWRGPYLGTGPINGADWRAYLSEADVQFPGSEYISGGTITVAALATSARLFLNNDAYIGPSYFFPPGSHPLEPKIEDPSDPKFRDGYTNVPSSGPGTIGYVPAEQITLDWDTWDQLIPSIAESRKYLGVHYTESVEAAGVIGRQVGKKAYNKALNLWKNSCRKNLETSFSTF